MFMEEEVFAALGDSVRRSLLEQLAREGPTRVVDLTAGRGISRPAVSRHLRILTDARLVRAVDVGRERHYELVDEGLSAVTAWVARLQTARAPTGSDAPSPPVTAAALDALDLEVRRTVRERTGPADTPHTDSSTNPTKESA